MGVALAAVNVNVLNKIPRVSVLVSNKDFSFRNKNKSCRVSAMAVVTEKMGIKIETNPPESKLTQLGVKQWPKWGCPPSKFPWTYSSKETCFLLKGKVKVYPDGEDEFVEFGAGDLVELPKGMTCTWDVSETVDKHYNFD
ncbi:Atp-dependent rna helicase ddx42 [Thalictrum thalictroides]|uniref:Atp-dependent rna helicase ddx42 n=1 Tax=Thalictrum thalictroides TaxID=46969 RepID=A0A7J6WHM7_THATH|nr:Atp-dependent rna helicase ddx42 [Thalictrum thalictroides]